MTTYLVLGAGGFQGGAIARRLMADGLRVRGLTRSAGQVPPGVEPVTGDLADRAALKLAFAGVTHVSASLPLTASPEEALGHTANIIEAARSASAGRLVFITANRVPAEPTDVAVFETARSVSRTVTASGLDAVVLRPPVYLDNLCAPWVAGPLLREGVLRYPLPAGASVAWLSHTDLATLAATALTSPGWEGVRDIGGPEPVTGPELAAAFSDVLGRTVTYAEQDPDEFAATLSPMVGAPAAERVAGTYRWMFSGGDADLYSAPRTGSTPLRTWIAAQPWEVLAR